MLPGRTSLNWVYGNIREVKADGMILRPLCLKATGAAPNIQSSPDSAVAMANVSGPVTTWFIIKFALDCRTVPTITVSNTVSNTVSITVSNTVSILVSNAIGYTVGKTVSNTVSYTVSNTFGNTVSNMVSNTISNTVIIILVLRWLPSLPRTCLLIPIFGLVDPRA